MHILSLIFGNNNDFFRTLMTINRTFINLLVLLDCLNSLGHIPTLIQYIVGHNLNNLIT